MEKQKSKKANLEKMKTLFFIISLSIVLALLNYAFNIQSNYSANYMKNTGQTIDNEIIPITRPPDVKPKPKPQEAKKYILDIINIVVNTEEPDTTEYSIPEFNDDPNLYNIPDEPDEEPIYNPSIKPQFPGGFSALQKYIAIHTEYPELAKRNDIEGTVVIKFEVTKKGRIGKVEVLNKYADDLLKNEAVRVIKTLPRFKPGIQNGQAVNVWYSVPVSFKLY